MNNKYNIYVKDLNIYKYYRISSKYFREMKNLTRPATLPLNISRQNNTLINDASMDVSFFNYFCTFSIGLMCYSFFNPSFIYDTSIFMAYSFAKMMINGYYVYTKYIYKPYTKYIHNPLMDILNIDNGMYEIQIVKNGNIIYEYKTMSDFIKNNKINFIYDDSETDDEEEEDDTNNNSSSELKEETNTNIEGQAQTQTQTQTQADAQNESNKNKEEVETKVDADLTDQNVDIHNSKSSACGGEDDDEDDEDEDEGDDDKEEELEVDSENTSDNDEEDEDNYILDPRKYDFVLRNIYFEDENLNTPFGFCLKYETFRKSDIKHKYTHEDLKNMLSTRRFIGIHLKTDDKDYLINISSPINYYIVDNTILDYSFLKMYMLNRYNVILGTTYKLSCIDNFIEMYSVEQGKKFLVKKNSFKLVDDETYRNGSETDSESESGSGSGSDSESGSESESESESGSESKLRSELESSSFHQNDDIEIVDCNFNEKNEE
jgi:hypothetical protein